MSNYNYTKEINADRLTQEIQQSSIVTALDHISIEGTDEVTITFKAALSSTDEDTLDSIVTAHINTPLDPEPQLVQLDEQRDSDGVVLQRFKIAATGSKFKTHHIHFKTADLDSLKERKENGNSFSYSSLKLYDSNGDIITDGANEGNAVKTVIEFEPAFTYEIIGGGIYQKELPASSIVAYAVFAPTIPEAYGGQIHFLNEAHLNMMGTGKILDLDGYVPKKINYDSANHSGRFNFTFHHAAGLQHELLMFIRMFIP